MKNSLVMFIFSVFDRFFLFLFFFFCFFFLLRNLFQKIKSLCLSWNLEPRLIQICRIRWRFSFFFSFLRLEIGNWVQNVVQKFKIVSLTWNLVPRLFQICKVWWSKVCDVHLCFRLFLVNVAQKSHFAFWCYLINLLTVYSQKLETSDFSCLSRIFGLQPASFAVRTQNIRQEWVDIYCL